MPTNFVIFDCDGGCDDAWALLLLLKAEEEQRIQLKAVTICGCGNTDLENAARNMLRILKANGRMDVPVYLGAAESLLPERYSIETKEKFGREDGFGDILEPDAELIDLKKLVQAEHGVVIINEICKKHSNEVSIIAVGPLTNLALCYNMYGKEFANSVKDIFIMGGNHLGIGNHSRAAEFNFYCDPEAAFIVLEKATCPITILPWEPCMRHNSTLKIEWRLQEFGKRASPNSLAIEILDKVEYSLWVPRGYDVWNPCDALLVAVYLFGECCVRKESHWHATVDLSGLHTRGQMVLDHLKKFPKNVRIIELVNYEIFKNVCEWVAGFKSFEAVQTLE